MNRLEFLTSLRYNLEKGGLPREDIEDALSYYEEIFLDSGYGSDEQTANMLGSPEELARDILIDNGIHPDGDAAYQVGESKKKPYSGAMDVDFEEVGKEGTNTQGCYNYGYGYNAGQGQNNNGQSAYNSASSAFNNAAEVFGSAAENFGKAMNSAFNSAKTTFDRNFNDPSMTDAQKSKRNNNILKILIVILSSPIWISIVAGLGSLLIGLLAGLFSLIAGLAATAVSLVAGGISQLFVAPPVGLMMLGGGMILLGIFGLVAKPSFRGLFKLCRTLVSGIKSLWKKIFG